MRIDALNSELNVTNAKIENAQEQIDTTNDKVTQAANNNEAGLFDKEDNTTNTDNSTNEDNGDDSDVYRSMGVELSSNSGSSKADNNTDSSKADADAAKAKADEEAEKARLEAEKKRLEEEKKRLEEEKEKREEEIKKAEAAAEEKARIDAAKKDEIKADAKAEEKKAAENAAAAQNTEAAKENAEKVEDAKKEACDGGLKDPMYISDKEGNTYVLVKENGDGKFTKEDLLGYKDDLGEGMYKSMLELDKTKIDPKTGKAVEGKDNSISGEELINGGVEARKLIKDPKTGETIISTDCKDNLDLSKIDKMEGFAPGEWNNRTGQFQGEFEVHYKDDAKVYKGIEAFEPTKDIEAMFGTKEEVKYEKIENAAKDLYYENNRDAYKELDITEVGGVTTDKDGNVFFSAKTSKGEEYDITAKYGNDGVLKNITTSRTIYVDPEHIDDDIVSVSYGTATDNGPNPKTTVTNNLAYNYDGNRYTLMEGIKEEVVVTKSYTNTKSGLRLDSKEIVTDWDTQVKTGRNLQTEKYSYFGNFVLTQKESTELNMGYEQKRLDGFTIRNADDPTGNAMITSWPNLDNTIHIEQSKFNDPNAMSIVSPFTNTISGGVGLGLTGNGDYVYYKDGKLYELTMADRRYLSGYGDTDFYEIQELDPNKEIKLYDGGTITADELAFFGSKIQSTTEKRQAELEQQNATNWWRSGRTLGTDNAPTSGSSSNQRNTTTTTTTTTGNTGTFRPTSAGTGNQVPIQAAPVVNNGVPGTSTPGVSVVPGGSNLPTTPAVTIPGQLQTYDLDKVPEQQKNLSTQILGFGQDLINKIMNKLDNLDGKVDAKVNNTQLSYSSIVDFLDRLDGKTDGNIDANLITAENAMKALGLFNVTKQEAEVDNIFNLSKRSGNNDLKAQFETIFA